MFCESRMATNCMRGAGVVYDKDLDMELCPRCRDLEREEAGLEPVDEDEDATAEE